MQSTEEKKSQSQIVDQTGNILTSQTSNAKCAIGDLSVGLTISQHEAKKLYGLMALFFKMYMNKEITMSEETVLSLLPLQEALAIQLDKIQGMDSDLSQMSKRSFEISGINE